MTSNLGSQVVQENVKQNNYEQLKNDVMKVVGEYFRPEFINRIDDSVVFHPLDQSNIHDITHIQLNQLTKRLHEQSLSLELSDPAITLLSEAGYDPIYGARPLKRAIQNYLENPLAQILLEGKFSAGDVIVATVEDQRIIFEKK